MTKLANVADSKSAGLKDPCGFKSHPRHQFHASPKPCPERSALLAYVVGIALGDGNLSNPNGRAVRLRISCDTRYPRLIEKITQSIQSLLPHNKVSFVRKQRKNCLDVSCFSNHWEDLLGWRAGRGSKADQAISVPGWIKKSNKYKVPCLRGLIETDGSIYVDRGYKMVMFTSTIPQLAADVGKMIASLGFRANTYWYQNEEPRSPVFRIRLSKRVDEFLALVQPEKC